MNLHFPKGERNYMVALGSLKVAVEREKPGSSIKVSESDPIGRHILKRRLERGMLQRQLAEVLGVCEDSITGWENGHSLPQISIYPRLIVFLGYVPFATAIDTIGKRIKYYRMTKGLSYKRMGKLVGVDASTVGSWENEKFLPKGKLRGKLEKLLGI